MKGIFSHPVPKHAKTRHVKVHRGLCCHLFLCYTLYTNDCPPGCNLILLISELAQLLLQQGQFSLQEFIKCEVQKFIWVLKMAIALTHREKRKETALKTRKKFRTEGLVNRQWPADRHQQKREEETEKKEGERWKKEQKCIFITILQALWLL